MGSYSQQGGHLINWDEHFEWCVTRTNWKSFIIEANDGRWTRSVGLLNFSGLDNWAPESGIYIGEVSSWKRGIGHKALELGLKWLKEQGYEVTHATILDNNHNSIGLYLGLGFVRIGSARQGESLYSKNLGEEPDSKGMVSNSE